MVKLGKPKELGKNNLFLYKKREKGAGKRMLQFFQQVSYGFQGESCTETW